jgi:hypothetical protein
MLTSRHLPAGTLFPNPAAESGRAPMSKAPIGNVLVSITGQQPATKVRTSLGSGTSTATTVRAMSELWPAVRHPRSSVFALAEGLSRPRTSVVRAVYARDTLALSRWTWCHGDCRRPVGGNIGGARIARRRVGSVRDWGWTSATRSSHRGKRE